MKPIDQETSSDQGFSPEWLQLRESADHAARSISLSKKVSAWAKSRPKLSVADLGAGTGSNLRYLAPMLGHNQHWTLLDHDDALLKVLPERLGDWAAYISASISICGDTTNITAETFSVSINCRQLDLSSELQDLPCHNTDLVTASALLDLTSADWLKQLTDQCILHQCTLLFSLSYNGLIRWQPAHEFDVVVQKALNAHQLSDKGFGPALGPGATASLKQTLESAGRNVALQDSDWLLAASEKSLQQNIVDSWFVAVKQSSPELQAKLENWHRFRTDQISDSVSSLQVGHTDLLSTAHGL
ncbi:MAG: class I SAM-dependent methyltransferase [Granulosicoccus sp.]|nr:class I SAM-dependent methyltransferase [Granulosicoccus sp.]